MALLCAILQSCIQVVVDFVSPECVIECIRLAEEFRKLPQDHDAKEDKLEVRPSLRNASFGIMEIFCSDVAHL